jgi:hypothetical protein
MRHLQQTLRYTHREDDIKMVARAIDLLGHHQVAEALEVLMAYRNYLQDAQRPVLEDYDPRRMEAR